MERANLTSHQMLRLIQVGASTLLNMVTVVFTPNERHILTITGQKESSIKFDPVRLLMYKDHIYITDYFNHYVIVMSLTGETISKFGGDFLHEPEGITIDSNGFVYVTSHHSKLVVF